MLDKKQQEAFDMAIENDISIILGYAGTGKSTVALEISKELMNRGWTVSMVAPTGKAAVRINGTTIHKWLQPEVEEDAWGNTKIIGWKKDFFQYKEVLIVDESSMVDTELWNQIMRVYNMSGTKKKIIFIGDPGQLKPVNEGTPFIDAIKNKKYPSCFLKNIHRTKNGSDINSLAMDIINNEYDLNKYKDVEIINIKKAIDILEKEDNVQVIIPSKKNINGVNNFNINYQKMLINKKAIGNKTIEKLKWENGWITSGVWLREGDKIICTRNDFGMDIVNGTIGTVVKFGHKKVFNERYRVYEQVKGLYFIRDYDGEEMFVTKNYASKYIDLAYAVTIHKFQGSESDIIILVSTNDQKWLFSQMENSLYTAVTRAKKKLYIVGEGNIEHDIHEFKELEDSPKGWDLRALMIGGNDE